MYVYIPYIYIYIYKYIYNLYIINIIMKTMCPLGYHHNGFVETHALGLMMYGYTLLVSIVCIVVLSFVKIKAYS